MCAKERPELLAGTGDASAPDDAIRAHATRARELLDLVHVRTAESERIEREKDHTDRITREAWKGYVQELEELRTLIPSDKLYGQCLKKYKLDSGLAANAGLRANALWCCRYAASSGRGSPFHSFSHPKARLACRAA